MRGALWVAPQDYGAANGRCLAAVRAPEFSGKSDFLGTAPGGGGGAPPAPTLPRQDGWQRADSRRVSSSLRRRQGSRSSVSVMMVPSSTSPTTRTHSTKEWESSWRWRRSSGHSGTARRRGSAARRYSACVLLCSMPEQTKSCGLGPRPATAMCATGLPIRGWTRHHWMP